MNSYNYLKQTNSQIAEQLNTKLRKFSASLALYKFETYMKVLENFFGYNNLKIKGIIN